MDTFTNHQLYKVSFKQDLETKKIQFYVTDRWGFTSAISNVLVTNSEDVIKKLSHLPASRRTQYLSQYLLRRLNFSNRYNVHVEEVKGQKVILFDSSGLKGGGRTAGVCFSSLQVIGGIILIGTGVGTIPGAVLLCSGLNGALYAYGHRGSRYQDSEFLKRSLVGGVIGGVTGGVGSLMGSGVLAGATSSAAGATTGSLINSGIRDDAPLNILNIAHMGFVGALTGGLGACISNGIGDVAHAGATTFCDNPVVQQLLNETDNISRSLTQVVGSMATGAITAAMLTAVKNIYEGEDVMKDIFYSAVIGASVFGATSVVRAAQVNHVGYVARVDAQELDEVVVSQNDNFSQKVVARMVKQKVRNQDNYALALRCNSSSEREHESFLKHLPGRELLLTPRLSFFRKAINRVIKAEVDIVAVNNDTGVAPFAFDM